MTEPLQNFSVPRNTDSTITVGVTTAVPNDTLVGCSILFALYEQSFGMVTNDTAILEKDTDPSGGITIPPSPLNAMEFDVAFTRTELRNLTYANYYYEATVLDEIGNQVCVISGIVTITVGENNP